MLEDWGKYKKTYQSSIDDFDNYVDAILKGGTLPDGTVVLKTDNAKLAELVRKSDLILNEQISGCHQKNDDRGPRVFSKRKKRPDRAMRGMEKQRSSGQL